MACKFYVYLPIFSLSSVFPALFAKTRMDRVFLIFQQNQWIVSNQLRKMPYENSIISQAYSIICSSIDAGFAKKNICK
jgi:hypothetical protein